MKKDNCYCWCPTCGFRLEKSDVAGWGCPKCGCKSTPCDPKLDVTVDINWHELRILGVFAENWATSITAESGTEPSRIVTAITSRLHRQYPEYTQLTLRGEIAALPETLADMGTDAIGVESNIPKPTPIHEFGPGAVGFARPKVSEDLIQHMRDRFLAWKLPENFKPDAGISFTPSDPRHPGPTGTNLLDAAQAEALIRYLVEELTKPEKE